MVHRNVKVVRLLSKQHCFLFASSIEASVPEALPQHASSASPSPLTSTSVSVSCCHSMRNAFPSAPPSQLVRCGKTWTQASLRSTGNTYKKWYSEQRWGNPSTLRPSFTAQSMGGYPHEPHSHANVLHKHVCQEALVVRMLLANLHSASSISHSRSLQATTCPFGTHRTAQDAAREHTTGHGNPALRTRQTKTSQKASTRDWRDVEKNHARHSKPVMVVRNCFAAPMNSRALQGSCLTHQTMCSPRIGHTWLQNKTATAPFGVQAREKGCI